jgi:hypothetical protein
MTYGSIDNDGNHEAAAVDFLHANGKRTLFAPTEWGAIDSEFARMMSDFFELRAFDHDTFDARDAIVNALLSTDATVHMIENIHSINPDGSTVLLPRFTSTGQSPRHSDVLAFIHRRTHDISPTLFDTLQSTYKNKWSGDIIGAQPLLSTLSVVILRDLPNSRSAGERTAAWSLAELSAFATPDDPTTNSILSTALSTFGSQTSPAGLWDFSERSIACMDHFIESKWPDLGPSLENFETMVWIHGCYVAAVLCRHYRGRLVLSDGGGPLFQCTTVGLNPWEWVRKRFQLQDGLAAQYEVFTRLAADDRH